jgi:hypothetical protein
MKSMAGAGAVVAAAVVKTRAATTMSFLNMFLPPGDEGEALGCPPSLLLVGVPEGRSGTWGPFFGDVACQIDKQQVLCSPIPDGVGNSRRRGCCD